MTTIKYSQPKNIFEQAIDYFYIEGQKVDGVYDLLVRGTGAKRNKKFVENWSDLDLSIIVETLNSNVLGQIQRIYRGIKQFFPYKLTLTPVSRSDFLNNNHRHGSKPIFYTYTLTEESTSLLKRQYHWTNRLDIQAQQQDCLVHIIILVHDIRSRFLKLEEVNDLELNEFFCHLVKRTKHIIRDGVFVKTGCVSEEIDNKILQDNFNGMPTDVNIYLESFKENYKYYANNSDFMITQIKEIIGIIESFYSQLIGE